eukprot:2133898-Amphidinium_carterae.2
MEGLGGTSTKTRYFNEAKEGEWTFSVRGYRMEAERHWLLSLTIKRLLVVSRGKPVLAGDMDNTWDSVPSAYSSLHNAAMSSSQP